MMVGVDDDDDNHCFVNKKKSSKPCFSFNENESCVSPAKLSFWSEETNRIPFVCQIMCNFPDVAAEIMRTAPAFAMLVVWSRYTKPWVNLSCIFNFKMVKVATVTICVTGYGHQLGHSWSWIPAFVSLCVMGLVWSSGGFGGLLPLKFSSKLSCGPYRLQIFVLPDCRVCGRWIDHDVRNETWSNLSPFPLFRKQINKYPPQK